MRKDPVDSSFVLDHPQGGGLDRSTMMKGFGKVGRWGLSLTMAGLLVACTATTEWLNDDPSAGVEKPSRPSAQEILARLGTEEAEPAPKKVKKPKPEPVAKPKPEPVAKPKPAPEPVVEKPGEEAPKKERKTFGETWKGWFGGKKKEEPAEPEAVVEVAEPEEPAKPEKTEKPAKPAKPKKRGVDVSQLDLKGEFPTAQPLLDRPGYVLSPYNGRLIKVEGIASGSLVADPRYPLDQRKYFRVP
jgi:hypothetical protein